MPDWALCDGDGDVDGDHCCYVAGEPCTYLEVDGPTGRRYACGLYAELGSWDDVHADARYLSDVKPSWDTAGVVDCGPWIGANRATMVAIASRGEITEPEFESLARCCFRRVWCSTPQRVRQAVRAVNRGL